MLFDRRIVDIHVKFGESTRDDDNIANAEAEGHGDKREAGGFR